MGLLGHFVMKQEIILSSSSMIRLMETLLALLPYMTWTTLIYSDKDVHVLKRLVVISCVLANQCIVTMWNFMLLFSRPSEPMVCPGVPSAKKPYAAQGFLDLRAQFGFGLATVSGPMLIIRRPYGALGGIILRCARLFWHNM